MVGALFLQPSLSADESLKVMTFNLRYASNSKPNAWPDRLPHMADIIKKTNPDIFGTQEGKFYQLKELNAKIPGYTWFGTCLLYTSPSPRDLSTSRMPSSA